MQQNAPRSRSSVSELRGYTLMLACASCGLKRRIDDFPTQAGLHLGDVLTTDNISIFKKGCLRCGVCRFVVNSIPPASPPPAGPVGWAKRPT